MRNSAVAFLFLCLGAILANTMTAKIGGSFENDIDLLRYASPRREVLINGIVKEVNYENHTMTIARPDPIHPKEVQHLSIAIDMQRIILEKKPVGRPSRLFVIDTPGPLVATSTHIVPL